MLHTFMHECETSMRPSVASCCCLHTCPSVRVFNSLNLFTQLTTRSLPIRRRYDCALQPFGRMPHNLRGVAPCSSAGGSRISSLNAGYRAQQLVTVHTARRPHCIHSGSGHRAANGRDGIVDLQLETGPLPGYEERQHREAPL